MNSRTIVANKQRNSSYHPSGAIASHVLSTTVAIDSTEKVLDLNGSYWVSSKFSGRYYRTVVENGVWFCSATDSRVAAMCKASVEAYIATLPPQEGYKTVQYASASRPGVVHTVIYNSKGEVANCSCETRKYNPKEDCKHMKAEKAKATPQVEYTPFVAA